RRDPRPFPPRRSSDLKTQAAPPAAAATRGPNVDSAELYLCRRRPGPAHERQPARGVNMRKPRECLAPRKQAGDDWLDGLEVLARSEEHTSELQSLRHL